MKKVRMVLMLAAFFIGMQFLAFANADYEIYKCSDVPLDLPEQICKRTEGEPLVVEITGHQFRWIGMFGSIPFDSETMTLTAQQVDALGIQPVLEGDDKKYFSLHREGLNLYITPKPGAASSTVRTLSLRLDSSAPASPLRILVQKNAPTEITGVRNGARVDPPSVQTIQTNQAIRVLFGPQHFLWTTDTAGEKQYLAYRDEWVRIIGAEADALTLVATPIGVQAELVLSEPGNYPISVWLDDGQAQTSRCSFTITVQDAPSVPSPEPKPELTQPKSHTQTLREMPAYKQDTNPVPPKDRVRVKEPAINLSQQMSQAFSLYNGVQPHAICIKPEEDVLLPLRAEMFGVQTNDGSLSLSALQKAGYNVHAKVENSAISPKISLIESDIYYNTKKNRTACIKMEFNPHLIDRERPYFSVLLYLKKDEKLFPEQGIRLSGIRSDTKVPVNEQEYVDLSRGQVAVANQDNREVRVNLGNGVSTSAVFLKGQQYFGVAELEPIYNPKRPSICKRYTLYTGGLARTGEVVRIHTGTNRYYVYDPSMRFLGTTDSDLPYTGTYYLSTKQL